MTCNRRLCLVIFFCLESVHVSLSSLRLDHVGAAPLEPISSSVSKMVACQLLASLNKQQTWEEMVGDVFALGAAQP